MIRVTAPTTSQPIPLPLPLPLLHLNSTQSFHGLYEFKDVHITQAQMPTFILQGVFTITVLYHVPC